MNDSVTSYPFLYAANFECENGPLFWQKDLPHFVGMVKQENQFYYDKKVWIEKQVYPSGEYTVYSWVKDARAIDPKYHDGGHRQGRRINLIEGVVIKGDHPNLPITSQFIEEVHQGLMPHFEAFFPMTLEEFNAHRASERWYNAQTFQFPTHVPDGHTPITEENIGRLPTQDFVKLEEQRSIKKDADQKIKEEKITEKPVTSVEKEVKNDIQKSGMKFGKIAAISCAVLAGVGCIYLWQHKAHNDNQQQDRWQKKIASERTTAPTTAAVGM